MMALMRYMMMKIDVRKNEDVETKHAAGWRGGVGQFLL